MKKFYSILYALLFLIPFIGYAQSIDTPFPQRKMKKDLRVFQKIREAGNSGLYTYRSKEAIDSIYKWAFDEIPQLHSYRDFYNLISQLTDFEGSIHNETYWSKKLMESLKKEESGYFPIPLKIVEGDLRVNSEEMHIPLGSKIVSINNHQAQELIVKLGKYYTTDGFNQNGKEVGINKHFSRYYRYHYGSEKSFIVRYQEPESNSVKTIVLESVGFNKYYTRFQNRHSAIIDGVLYDSEEGSEAYSLKKVDSTTAILTIDSFSFGEDDDKDHLAYQQFLDSVFTNLNHKEYKNLIVDIRNNGGGQSPNDMITLSYLADSPQKEIREAWVSFTKNIPYWRYLKMGVPFWQKPIAKIKFKKILKEMLPIVRERKRYYSDIKTYAPNKNRFRGQVYLLTGPAVASAASLFAAMVSSNTDTILVGEETGGGYYGHNGAFPVTYRLPNSKFDIRFSVVNLTQDVKEKPLQPFGRGVIPDYKVSQNFNDFIKNNDTQMEFVLDLIAKNIDN